MKERIKRGKELVMNLVYDLVDNRPEILAEIIPDQNDRFCLEEFANELEEQKNGKLESVPVYSYSELSDSHKRHAHRDIATFLAEHADISDEIENYMNELRGFGFINIDIVYQTNGGVSWTGKISANDARKLVGLAEVADDFSAVSFIRHHWYYAVEFICNWLDLELEKLRSWYDSYRHRMYRTLSEFEASLSSDDAVDEWIEDNDPRYVIAANGKPVMVQSR